uniref:Uncharacterized protein n=1 Tax=virus sp. ctE0n6 TaxID=2827985 RepID=A0A8S5RFS6_9VIRU|nr:MAG TPA: hypothetical protein [virus sp. ctE0n6]
MSNWTCCNNENHTPSANLSDTPLLRDFAYKPLFAFLTHFIFIG